MSDNEDDVCSECKGESIVIVNGRCASCEAKRRNRIAEARAAYNQHPACTCDSDTPEKHEIDAMVYHLAVHAASVVQAPRMFLVIASEHPSPECPLGRSAFRSNIEGGIPALIVALREFASKLENEPMNHLEEPVPSGSAGPTRH
jgi:hypothetical protein